MSAELNATFVQVADKRSIPLGKAISVVVGRYDVAIFNAAGVFYAYENVCPHQGAPIVDGAIDETSVTCSWHAWCFDLRTGKLTLGEYAELRRFDLKVEGDALFIATEPSPEARA